MCILDAAGLRRRHALRIISRRPYRGSASGHLRGAGAGDSCQSCFGGYARVGARTVKPALRSCPCWGVATSRYRPGGSGLPRRCPVNLISFNPACRPRSVACPQAWRSERLTSVVAPLAVSRTKTFDTRGSAPEPNPSAAETNATYRPSALAASASGAPLALSRAAGAAPTPFGRLTRKVEPAVAATAARRQTQRAAWRRRLRRAETRDGLGRPDV